MQGVFEMQTKTLARVSRLANRIGAANVSMAACGEVIATVDPLSAPASVRAGCNGWRDDFESYDRALLTPSSRPAAIETAYEAACPPPALSRMAPFADGDVDPSLKHSDPTFFVRAWIETVLRKQAEQETEAAERKATAKARRRARRARDGGVTAKVVATAVQRKTFAPAPDLEVMGVKVSHRRRAFCSTSSAATWDTRPSYLGSRAGGPRPNPLASVARALAMPEVAFPASDDANGYLSCPITPISVDLASLLASSARPPPSSFESTAAGPSHAANTLPTPPPPPPPSSPPPSELAIQTVRSVGRRGPAPQPPAVTALPSASTQAASAPPPSPPMPISSPVGVNRVADPQPRDGPVQTRPSILDEIENFTKHRPQPRRPARATEETQPRPRGFVGGINVDAIMEAIDKRRPGIVGSDESSDWSDTSDDGDNGSEWGLESDDDADFYAGFNPSGAKSNALWN